MSHGNRSGTADEGLSRLAMGIAWGLDSEPGDDPEIFWAVQSPEYRSLLLAGAEVLREKLVEFYAVAEYQRTAAPESEGP